MKLALAVPTLNAAAHIDEFLAGIQRQSKQPERFIVYDSSSADRTVDRLREYGAEVTVIDRAIFDHGRTRQDMVERCDDLDAIIFMTQDAICANADSFARLIAPLADPKIGAVCGRQLPRSEAGPLEAHARLFNYPSVSAVRTKSDIGQLGVRAAFLSNSFAAYRLSALRSIGGFPSDNIVNEDMYVAARLLLSDRAVAYAADAQVFHSHPYRISDEFRRYFDIGVFFARNAWIRDRFGDARGEGRRFVASEMRWLVQRHPAMMPGALCRNAAKLVGIECGRRERFLSRWMKQRMSAQRSYWVVDGGRDRR